MNLDLIFGKVAYQRFFRKLHQLSLRGMNFGNGGDFRISGEKTASEYVRDNLKNDELLVLFDVGANSGHYSIQLTQVFTRKNVILYSFEPSLTTFNTLQRNTETYEVIHSYNVGLGDKEEKMNLYSNEKSSPIASVYNRQLDHFDISMKLSEEISIKTIDSFCKQEGVNRINFLKLDIEGHEFKALLGAKDMLNKKAIDYIQFEFGGTCIDSRNFFQDFWYLLNDQYNLYRIVRDGLMPITRYSEVDEIFVAINYLAELKK